MADVNDTNLRPSTLAWQRAARFVGAMSQYKRPSPLSTPALRRRVSRTAADEGGEADSWTWAQNNRGRAAASPLPTAARAASRVMRPLSRRFGPTVADLDEHWVAIVGEALAKYTRPEKFQGGASGSILLVRARGPAAALVEAQTPKILERVARYSGRTPTRLKIVQGPLHAPASKPKAKVQRIKKVDALSLETRGLDNILAELESAIAMRETPASSAPSSKE